MEEIGWEGGEGRAGGGLGEVWRSRRGRAEWGVGVKKRDVQRAGGC